MGNWKGTSPTSHATPSGGNHAEMGSAATQPTNGQHAHDTTSGPTASTVSQAQSTGESAAGDPGKGEHVNLVMISHLTEYKLAHRPHGR